MIQAARRMPRHRARYGEEKRRSPMEEATEIEPEHGREIQRDGGMGETERQMERAK